MKQPEADLLREWLSYAAYPHDVHIVFLYGQTATARHFGS